MHHNLRDTLLTFLIAASLPLTQGCGSKEEEGGNGGKPGANQPIVPNAEGWIDPSSNSLGIQGSWYTYGDAQAADSKCPNSGWTADQCSQITTPPAGTVGFPNSGGVMCTAGSAAQVLTPAGGTDPDYGSMWGAGIGVDLNNAGADNTTKAEWHATGQGIVGVAFDIDNVTPLRVEFPMTATEGHADGSNYWGATPNWPNSPIVAGHNVVYFTEVSHPNGAVPLDPTNVSILGIQFHVPTNTDARTPYAFCISNLSFVTQ